MRYPKRGASNIGDDVGAGYSKSDRADEVEAPDTVDDIPAYKREPHPNAAQVAALKATKPQVGMGKYRGKGIYEDPYAIPALQNIDGTQGSPRTNYGGARSTKPPAEDPTTDASKGKRGGMNRWPQGED